MSSSEALNQDEIDALLNDGSADPNKSNEEKSISNNGNMKSYDFSNPDKVTRERLPALEMINERLARSMRVNLFNFLRRGIEIQVEGVEIKKFADYMRSLYVPTSINLIKMLPLKGTAMLILDAKLVYILVDNYFGGFGKFHNKIEGRDFTPTEMRIIRLLVEEIFKDLKSSWEHLLEITPSYYATEVNPSMANIIGPSDIIVINKFMIEIDGGSGYLHLALPYTMLEPIRDKLKQGMHRDGKTKDEEWVGSIQNELLDVEVFVKCNLSTKKITLRDAVNFMPGNIIPIKISETLEMQINGIPTFKCKYGIVNGKAGLKVLNKIVHK